MLYKMKKIFGSSLSPRNFAENSGEFLARLFEEHGKLPIIIQYFQFLDLGTVYHTQKTLMFHKLSTPKLSFLYEIH